MKDTDFSIQDYFVFDQKRFQKTINGKQTDLYILKNKLGMAVGVTNYGCALTAIFVPDKKGKMENVVLSYDSIDDLLNAPEPFLSTTIGRYGNRIANGTFQLNGEEYKLETNNGPNSLHGGPTGFHARVWDANQLSDNKIEFSYISEDGEEGFPGKVTVGMIYELSDDSNSLIITYQATTDAPTVINLTNHGFFNLAGTANPTPSIEDNEVVINADFFIPIDDTSIPTGEILLVEDTPMDFRTPYTVGSRIEEDFVQLKRGAGYDHCYVLNKKERNELSFAASCFDAKSGRKMEVYTTELGVQLYTGNWLGGFKGGDEATFPARSAICFEAQCFPDTPNQTHFPTATFQPGEVYEQATIYKFTVEE